jgi:putative DNA primase/helicase
MASEQDIIAQFRTAMAEADILVDDDIIADGKIHRYHVQDDRKGSKNAWAILFIDSTPAGSFGCNKRFGEKVKFKWSLQEDRAPLTTEERRAFAAKMAETRARKAAEEAQRHANSCVRAVALIDASKPAAEHPYLARKAVKAHGIRIGAWPVTNPDTGEVTIVSETALLIPLRDIDKKVWSVQAVFADKSNILGRDKDFLSGGRKQGLFFTIGKPVDKTFVLGEGYATCATIHEATGHAVVVCFDRGNLIHVARILRAKFPGHRIIVAADNDQWTTAPVDNPGLTDARAAAIAVEGLLAVPPFVEADCTADFKPTDFNDLAALRGADAVRAEFAAPFDPAVKEPDAAPHLHLVGLEDIAGAPENAPLPVDDDGIPPTVRANMFFSMLGYDHERYFIFNHKKRQIVIYTKGDFSDGGLIELAPLLWWESHFSGGAKGGIDKRSAMDVLVRLAHQRGIYDISRIRGRGAWTDRGRIVYHHGGHLTVDGVDTDITELDSKYVYELNKSLPDMATTPMTDADGKRVLELASIFRWTRPGSAVLLAGWLALAPVCGGIKWRPHIWLSGSAGCGKSSVLNEYVHWFMNGCDLFCVGSSTEAGIRQELKGDALPVLFDESESNNDREALRIQSILALARQSSSEMQAKTYKGTAGGDALSFHIRSMFCMASIQVGIKYQADIERVVVLSLLPKGRDDPDPAATWQTMSARIRDVQADDDLPGRLFRRALTLLPTTLKNIKVFAEVAATKFGSQRDGDQYGTLLAGAWSLISTELATYQDAANLIEKYDWSEHRESNEVDEGQRAISALMEAHIRVSGADVTVNELIRTAKGYEVLGMNMANDAAHAILARYGMRIDGMRLMLSNNSGELKKLMAGTPFEADLRGVLLRTKGCLRVDRPVKFSGVVARCISIPLDDLISDDVEYAGTDTVVRF